MRRYIKLLYPGLGIKRWLALFIIGFLVMAVACAALLMTVAGINALLDKVVDSLVAFVGLDWLTLLLVAGLGLAAMVVAGICLLRSVLVDLVPGRGKAVDTLYQVRHLRRGPRVVVIGGGTGLSMLLRGLKEFTSNITAVVTVADDGGSSGILRGELGVPPPGDIRNCLVALADTEPLLERLFQYRFSGKSGLGGHSFGNLFLAAMTQMLGFQQAVRESGRVLAIRGKVLPVSEQPLTLRAHCADGSVIVGESNIGRADTVIEKLALEPAGCRPLPEVIQDILAADAVIVGPGSLYTSLLPNLLVSGVAEAIRASSALRFYVCNIMTQRGETHGYTAADHLRAIEDHVGPGLFDYIVVNSQQPDEEMLARYSQEGAEPVLIDRERLRQMHIGVLARDLLAVGPVARHNSDALARLILSRVVAEPRSSARLFDLLFLEARLRRMNGGHRG